MRTKLAGILGKVPPRGRYYNLSDLRYSARTQQRTQILETVLVQKMEIIRAVEKKVNNMQLAQQPKTFNIDKKLQVVITSLSDSVNY